MILEWIERVSTAVAAINPWLLVLSLLAFVFVFLAYQTNKTERLNWADMLTVDGPGNRVSLTKVLQLVGGVVGTWFIIQTTIANGMNSDYFMIYLAYVGAIEGWSKFVAMRYGGLNGNDNGYRPGYGGGYGGYGGGYGRPPYQRPNQRVGNDGLGDVSDDELDAAMDQQVRPTPGKPSGSKAARKPRGSG